MAVACSGRQREIVRLRHEISYYCGVLARTASRERMRAAHAAIRRCEQQLEKAFDVQPQPTEENA